MKYSIIGLIAFLIVKISLISQDKSPWTFNGQLQLRHEIDGRDFLNKSRALNFSSMRTRLSVTNNFFDNASFLVQIQDSRVFGSEPSTLSSLDNLDIHQAFVTINEPLNIPINLKAGRFEFSYGTQRFFGAVGWHYVGRSFDGMILSIDPAVKIDFFALTNKNNQTYIGNALPDIYHDSLPSANSWGIYGFWANKKINESNNVHLFSFYEANNNKTNGTDPDLSMLTSGATYSGKFDNLNTTAEAAYQLGSKMNKDISAYLISLQAHYLINSFSVGIGGDIISGTAPDEQDEYNSFETSYGTNHKFYGYMDYFINVAANSNKLGLRDYYFKLKWIPENINFNIAADFHIMTSDKRNMESKNSFGNELDLTLNYLFNDKITLTWGGSIFTPGELMTDKFSTAKYDKSDTAFWTYFMLNANF
jgi:hypothetical protein